MFHSISTLLEDSPNDNPADSLSTTPAEESHDTYDTYQVSRPPTPSSLSGQSLASALGTSQVSLKRKRQREGTETSKKTKGQPDSVEAAIVESLKLVQSGHAKEHDDDVHFGRQISATPKVYIPTEGSGQATHSAGHAGCRIWLHRWSFVFMSLKKFNFLQTGFSKSHQLPSRRVFPIDYIGTCRKLMFCVVC